MVSTELISLSTLMPIDMLPSHSWQSAVINNTVITKTTIYKCVKCSPFLMKREVSNCVTVQKPYTPNFCQLPVPFFLVEIWAADNIKILPHFEMTMFSSNFRKYMGI